MTDEIVFTVDTSAVVKTRRRGTEVRSLASVSGVIAGTRTRVVHASTATGASIRARHGQTWVLADLTPLTSEQTWAHALKRIESHTIDTCGIVKTRITNTVINVDAAVIASEPW